MIGAQFLFLKLGFLVAQKVVASIGTHLFLIPTSKESKEVKANTDGNVCGKDKNVQAARRPQSVKSGTKHCGEDGHSIIFSHELSQITN